jgi:NAD(P)-dependent dehydrogenase (short-subunit alcohol dehydrogenase family)
MIRLDGKVVLISGAARGIGGEPAQLMAKAGATPPHVPGIPRSS